MNIPEEAVEAVKSVLRDEGLDEEGGNPHSWRCEFPDLYPNHCTCVDDLARAALEAAWAVMRPEITDDEIARDLDSRIPNDAPLWLERQVADRRAIADTVRHFARGGHGSTE